MAYVLVQHLDPSHESALTELLAKATEMPVSQVMDAMLVEPDHVYVIPPNVDMIISKGILRLTPRTETRWPSHANRSFLTLARGGPAEQCDWGNSFRNRF